MFTSNFMLQDLMGVLLAVLLFTTILAFPGYVIGYFLDLLNFKKRQSAVQFGIAVILSVSLSPIILFLAYRLGSRTFAFSLLLGFGVIFTILIIQVQGMQRLLLEIKQNPYLKAGVVVGGIWIVVATIFLIDLQWGQRLYYNIIAYDYATRASVINSITRTGVPPINPSYYPGTPQRLTYLYYFWYVLCSLVDQMGGKFVDARTALMASAIWAGLALMIMIALFTRLRNPTDPKDRIWQKTWLGISLLLVSGLDVFPSTFYILFPKLFVGRIIEGDIEQWNEQITAWIGSISWTPHHVISLLACLLAWFLIKSTQDGDVRQQLAASLSAGMALASAFGLSVWVTIIFIIFWSISGISRFIQLRSIFKLWPMILPGIVAMLAILPFLLDLLKPSGASTTVSQFPFMVSSRFFYPLEFLHNYFPDLNMLLLYTLAIPLNYFLELGFFFVVAFLWLRLFAQTSHLTNPYATQENLLLLIVIVLVTFLRSTVIANNDFGWRGWMFGQFILIFWGVDVIQYFWNSNSHTLSDRLKKPKSVKRIRSLLSLLFTIGILTSFYDIVLLRSWPILVDTGILGFPRTLTSDNHLGERTFAARVAFTFIDNNLPANTIIQFDPRIKFDFPSGLYRSRTTAISYHTLYGVPSNIYMPLITQIGHIFDQENNRWQTLDSACQKFHIEFLILRDRDPIWRNLEILKSNRSPVFENHYFAIFKCGNK